MCGGLTAVRMRGTFTGMPCIAVEYPALLLQIPGPPKRP